MGVENVIKGVVTGAGVLVSVSGMPENADAQTHQSAPKPTLVRGSPDELPINFATTNPAYTAAIQNYVESGTKYSESRTALMEIIKASKNSPLDIKDIPRIRELFAKSNFKFVDQLDFFNEATFATPNANSEVISEIYKFLIPYLHPQIILWEKSLPMAIHIRQDAELNLNRNTNSDNTTTLNRIYQNEKLFSWYGKLEAKTREDEDMRLDNLNKVFNVIRNMDLLKNKDIFIQVKWAQIINNNLRNFEFTNSITTKIVLDEYRKVLEFRKKYGGYRPFSKSKIVTIRNSQKTLVDGKQTGGFFNDETEEMANIAENTVKVRTLSEEAQTQTEINKIYTDIITDQNTKIFYHIGHGHSISSDRNGQGVNNAYMDLGKSSKSTERFFIQFQDTAKALVKRFKGIDADNQKPEDMVWIVADMCNSTDAVNSMQPIIDQENQERLKAGLKPMPPFGFVASASEREFTIFQKKYNHQTTLSRELFSDKTLGELIDTTPEGSAYTFHIFNLPDPTSSSPRKIQLGELENNLPRNVNL